MKWFFYLLVPFFLFASPQDDLYRLFDIPPSAAPEEILQTVQKLWMQQGKERWQFQSRYEDLRPQVWPLLQQMGMMDAVPPSKQHYDTVLVLGALFPRVQNRVDYLRDCQITFDHLVFLGGERPLLDSEKEKLPNLQTESEMMRWVYEHSDLSKEIPVLFIEVPMKGEKRPNTLDTIHAWLQEADPHPTSCLAISNQPYVHYQEAVFNRCTPFAVEVAGAAVIGAPSVDLMLDTLAREMTYKYGSIEWLQQ